MKIKISLTLLVLSFPFRMMIAQETYDLNRCILTGLENNYSIQLSRNRETISDNNFTRGNAGYLPSVDLSGRYSGTLNSTTQNLVDGTVNSTDPTHNISASSGVALNWTIFDGFNVQTTYKKLGELKNAGELSTKLSVENLISDIVSEYYNFIQQKRLYQNLEFAVSLSRERVRIDEERYLLGSSSKLQLLQSKVYFNSDSSRLARQNEVLKESEIRLNELMAVDELGQTLIINDTLLHINEDLVYDDLLDETLTSNTSLLISRSNKVVSEYDYKIIASRSYPYFNFSTGYNYSLSIYGSGTYKNQHVNGMNYGLTMGLNLFDGFNQQRSKMNAAIEIKNRELQYLQLEQQVKADLLSIYSGYMNNLGLLRLEEENLRTATENLDIAFERYKLGDLSGLDLREVQKSLLDAEERLLQVQYQIKIAEISLLQISGRITDYI